MKPLPQPPISNDDRGWQWEWYDVLFTHFVPKAISDLKTNRESCFLITYISTMIYEPLIVDMAKYVIEEAGVEAHIVILGNLLFIRPGKVIQHQFKK